MQPALLDLSPRLDGPDLSPADQIRLATQLDRVIDLMQDGRPRTLKTIAVLVRGSEASVSARLRDLRKVRFGSWTVTRKRIAGGLWSYKVTR